MTEDSKRISNNDKQNDVLSIFGVDDAPSKNDHSHITSENSATRSKVDDERANDKHDVYSPYSSHSARSTSRSPARSPTRRSRSHEREHRYSRDSRYARDSRDSRDYGDSRSSRYSRSTNLEGAKYFLFKSHNLEDLPLGVRLNLWNCPKQAQDQINYAFEKSYAVYCIFASKYSNFVFGFAEMVSRAGDEKTKKYGFPWKNKHISRGDSFMVKWRKWNYEISYKEFEEVDPSISAAQLLQCKDGGELPADLGKKVTAVIDTISKRGPPSFQLRNYAPPAREHYQPAASYPPPPPPPQVYASSSRYAPPPIMAQHAYASAYPPMYEQHYSSPPVRSAPKRPRTPENYDYHRPDPKRLRYSEHGESITPTRSYPARQPTYSPEATQYQDPRYKSSRASFPPEDPYYRHPSSSKSYSSSYPPRVPSPTPPVRHPPPPPFEGRAIPPSYSPPRSNTSPFSYPSNNGSSRHAYDDDNRRVQARSAPRERMERFEQRQTSYSSSTSAGRRYPPNYK